MLASDIHKIEEKIKVTCQIVWPSENPPGPSFQRSVGRTLDSNINLSHSIFEFPLSLLRNHKDFENFCKEHLRYLKARVNKTWELRLHLDLDALEEQRSMFPEVVHSSVSGPASLGELGRLSGAIWSAVEVQWCGLQSYYIQSQMALEATGMTNFDSHRIYRQLWDDKEGGGRHSPAVDASLRDEYLRLARDSLSKSDIEMGAQYSKVAFDLSSDQAASYILSEFGEVAAHWKALEVSRENAVKKVATVAREGVAEYWKFKVGELYRRGMISPLTENTRQYLSSEQSLKEREKLMRKSSTNPYRRGLELVEATEAQMGPVSVLIHGIITEWPLEALRLRVPAYVVKTIQKNSPLSPDLRLAKLVEVSKNSPQEGIFKTSPQEIMPVLLSVHRHLDDPLTGFRTGALCQLDIERRKYEDSN